MKETILAVVSNPMYPFVFHCLDSRHGIRLGYREISQIWTGCQSTTEVIGFLERYLDEHL